MARHDGYIKFYRSILDNPIWTSEPFTKGQAWADLLLLVNHEDGIGRKGDLIPRGSMATSYATLAIRWRWSVSKVRRFLGTLSDTQMISLSGTRSGTLLSIVKYDNFQGARHTNRHTERHTDDITGEQPTRIKEYKEEKKSNTRRNKTVQEKLAAIDARRRRLEEGGE